MVSDFKKNRKSNLWKRFLLSLGGILISFILILLIIANVKIYSKKQEYLSQIQNLKNQVKDIQNRNDSLKQGIKNADNEEYIEKIAREELDLQKQGEQVVSFIVPQPKEQKDNNLNKNIFQVWLGWISSGWDFIKNKF